MPRVQVTITHVRNLPSLEPLTALVTIAKMQGSTTTKTAYSEEVSFNETFFFDKVNTSDVVSICILGGTNQSLGDAKLFLYI